MEKNKSKSKQNATKKVEKKVDKKVETKKGNFWSNVFAKIKKFFGVKRNLILVLVALIIVIVLILILIKPTHSKFALNEIYDVYPEEVRELYSNFVSVSCTGDIHFNIEVDKGAVDIEKMSKEDLLNYMFSYMDKNDLLIDIIDDNTIKGVENQLFDKKLNLIDDIKSFSYNGYKYSLSGGKVKREIDKCPESEISYVTHLYGYFYHENRLSIDINVGYLKNGTLYSYDDEPLGEYDGDVTKLLELMQTASYYRATYTRYGENKYKLLNMEWKHKS